MKRSPPPVMGIKAPPPRPTFRSALWLACSLSLPVFALLALAEAAWRWLL
ncbi:hypothetical protein [Tropicimonas aquimaris]|uniref:Uncharacterized protein n=1 Tax=Tropicimonas aquimaris TaxID=914152 RepID=A0ABW3IL19_9RHOB